MWILLFLTFSANIKDFSHLITAHKQVIRRLVSSYLSFRQGAFNYPGVFELIAVHDFLLSKWHFSAEEAIKPAYEIAKFYIWAGYFKGDSSTLAIILASIFEYIGRRVAVIRDKFTHYTTMCIFMPSLKLVKATFNQIKACYSRVSSSSPYTYIISGKPCMQIDWLIGGAVKLNNIEVLYVSGY